MAIIAYSPNMSEREIRIERVYNTNTKKATGTIHGAGKHA
jgi:hypothetical protein